MIFFDRISIGMMAKGHHDITGMLAAWNDGSAEALDRVIDVIYPQLRRIARKHLARRNPRIRGSGERGLSEASAEWRNPLREPDPFPGVVFADDPAHPYRPCAQS